MNKGFTLIELAVSVAVVAILAVIVLFSIAQYINKGKDANISGNLSVLISAGESYYNIGNTYSSFCASGATVNIISQMPENPNGSCYNASANKSGVCCNVSLPVGDAWMACAREFTNTAKAFCSDSRGVKKEIDSAK